MSTEWQLSQPVHGCRSKSRVSDLVSVPADFGCGANDGAYYPVGLLTIGSSLRHALPGVAVRVVDVHHQPNYRPNADIVGSSASSALNYRNVLFWARQAKAAGATVVLGGPHATRLAEQILRNRPEIVDFVIRGNGEVPFGQLLRTLEAGQPLDMVPGLAGDALPGRSPTTQFAGLAGCMRASFL